jgi:exopolysaccharide production protein ExoZ
MLVVFNHAGLLALGTKNHFGPSLLVPSRAVAEMGAIGVDLFFVISGFVMALSARRFAGPMGAGAFLALRFVRIAPLFYLASLAMLAVSLRGGAAIDPSSVLNSLTFIPIFDDETYSWPLHYLGWTLAFEFAFYLVVAALIASGRGARADLLLAAIVSIPFLGFLLQAQSAAWKVLTNPILWEFALGVFAYLLWERRWIRWLRLPFAILAGLALVAIVIALWLGQDQLAASGWDAAIGNASYGTDTVEGVTSASRTLYWGFPMFLFFCAVVGFAGVSDAPCGRLLKLLGDASYSIYLSHLFVIMLMTAVVERLALHPDLVVVASLIGAAVVGIVVYRLAEKPMLMKGQKSLRKWTLKHVRNTG